MSKDNDKNSQIDHFGGHSENHRKIVLGSINIIKKCQKHVLGATNIRFFDNTIVQKRGGGRRPPPLFWERPEAATILRGPSGIHQNRIFCQFSINRGFYRVCRGRPTATLVHLKVVKAVQAGAWTAFALPLHHSQGRSLQPLGPCLAFLSCPL